MWFVLYCNIILNRTQHLYVLCYKQAYLISELWEDYIWLTFIFGYYSTDFEEILNYGFMEKGIVECHFSGASTQIQYNAHFASNLH